MHCPHNTDEKEGKKGINFNKPCIDIHLSLRLELIAGSPQESL